MKSLIIFGLIICLVSCDSYQRKERVMGNAIVKFDLQGHRGARGLAPENSIPGMWKALSLGVVTLEMDLAVTKDKQLILSHEPWFSHFFCTDSTRQAIAEDQERTFNIYQMTYEETQKFDCGSTRHPNFPEQETVSVSKPKLIDVVRSAEQLIVQKGHIPVNYNIEIKSHPQGDNVFHPSPQEFSDLVYNTLNGLLPWNRIIIQSFDFRVLQYFNEKYPDVRLAALIENQDGVDKNIEELGFTPEIYSCYYKLLSEEVIGDLHNRDMLVIPWTINEVSEMEQLFEWGVDGLITDYPDRFWGSRINPHDVIEYIKEE